MRRTLAIILLGVFLLPGESLAQDAKGKSSATRARLCEVQKKQLGLPIVLDPDVKAKLVEKLGEADAAKLVRPIARANIAHRCLCDRDPAFRELNCNG